MLANELDAPVQMHVHETEHEVQESLREYGCRPLSRLNALDLLTPRFQAVHLTAVDESDIELLANSGTHAIHCPTSKSQACVGILPGREASTKASECGFGNRRCCQQQFPEPAGRLSTSGLTRQGGLE